MARAKANPLATLALPEDLESIVYRHECGSKQTFGRDYMIETGQLPGECAACGEPLGDQFEVIQAA